ncbi:lipase secretion chaperone [Chiayiivirga flava]|uniref:Lipase chaperone n=1 Tax=Chiayiivirga flava TaxID=659595 RepID=A0A7W8D5Z0_9GAMM|nr:lipase secretion chaperone [Chiayiivirga flava]MBB5208541.1 lipase chaperone LimK [Chiayiivirga flava]
MTMQRLPRRALPVLGAGVAVLVGVTLPFWRGAAPATQAYPAEQHVRAATALPDPAPASGRSDAPAPPSHEPREDAIAALRTRFAQSSLRGTTPDGALALDAAGRVVANAELRRLFEWYLALTGEFELTDIRSLFAADQRDAHGAAAAADALALFDRYIGLREAAARIDGSLDDLAYLDALIALRRQWFGADADAMFGAEEAAQALSLERLAVVGDPTLDATERNALLADIDARQPPDERDARARFTDAELAGEQTRQLDALAADPATRHAERSALFGDDAATRLAALDADRAAWQRRIDDYVRSRDALRSDTSLDPASRATRLATLRERSFADHERRRIDALDAIGALPPGG